jgi:hypothetical protein
MSDKTKTKAELLEMLAEAVRNTQPPPVRNTQPEPVGAAPTEPRSATKPKTRPAPKRTGKIKSVRASAGRKQRRR